MSEHLAGPMRRPAARAMLFALAGRRDGATSSEIAAEIGRHRVYISNLFGVARDEGLIRPAGQRRFRRFCLTAAGYALVGVLPYDDLPPKDQPPWVGHINEKGT